MNKKLQKILKNDTKKNKNANKKLIKHASSHLKYKDYVAKSASQQNKENNTEA